MLHIIVHTYIYTSCVVGYIHFFCGYFLLDWSWWLILSFWLYSGYYLLLELSWEKRIRLTLVIYFSESFHIPTKSSTARLVYNMSSYADCKLNKRVHQLGRRIKLKAWFAQRYVGTMRVKIFDYLSQVCTVGDVAFFYLGPHLL